MIFSQLLPKVPSPYIVYIIFQPGLHCDLVSLSLYNLLANMQNGGNITLPISPRRHFPRLAASSRSWTGKSSNPSVPALHHQTCHPKRDAQNMAPRMRSPGGVFSLTSATNVRVQSPAAPARWQLDSEQRSQHRALYHHPDYFHAVASNSKHCSIALRVALYGMASL